ncbi:MAG: hypothetical protein FJ279_22560, partial [Planctomycetes bacterium]|nr:hypothetical protein [Planctomycetota bacterium]
MADVRAFGARGDGRADDTQAIQRAVKEGDGLLIFPRGVYRVTRPIEVALADCGPASISGSDGVARVVMEGAGPAFHLLGTHEG